MDKYKTEILQQWLDKGKNDLRSAEYLSTMQYPTPDEIICFLCQQTAEKYLKAFIFLQDIEPEKTHDLEKLLGIFLPFVGKENRLFHPALDTAWWKGTLRILNHFYPFQAIAPIFPLYIYP